MLSEGMEEVGDAGESDGQEVSDGEIEDQTTSAERAGGVTRVGRLRTPSNLGGGSGCDQGAC